MTICWIYCCSALSTRKPLTIHYKFRMRIFWFYNRMQFLVIYVCVCFSIRLCGRMAVWLYCVHVRVIFVSESPIISIQSRNTIVLNAFFLLSFFSTAAAPSPLPCHSGDTQRIAPTRNRFNFDNAVNSRRFCMPTIKAKINLEPLKVSDIYQEIWIH